MRSTPPILAALCLAGCLVDVPGSSDLTLEELVTQHVYDRPCADVERAGAALLRQRGYVIRDSDSAAVVTELREEPGGAARYTLILQAPEVSACALEALRTEASQGVGSRDWELELDILDDVDPAVGRHYRRIARSPDEDVEDDEPLFDDGV